jgi:3-oxo-5-alpha-steroid 4-dehydrogenase 1
MISTLFISIFALMNIYFVIALLKKNFGLVDVAWGQGFMLIAIMSYFYHFNSPKNALVLTLVLIWGLRLSFYLMKRNWNAEEDFRYHDLRKSWEPHPLLHAYFKVFLFQGIMMFIISLPVTFGMARPVQTLSTVNKIGIVIFFCGWIFESYSDRYLKKFKQDPSNQGKICTTGPWRICRFPNYLGEIVLWYGIYLASFVPSIWWTIVGPVTINFFILKVSGVPLLEKRYLGRSGYLDYSSKVPRLIPFTSPRKVSA